MLHVGHQLAFDYIQLLNFFQKKIRCQRVSGVRVSLSASYMSG